MADWNVIKTEYVTGDDSIYKLAKDHGLCDTTVYRRARNEGWEQDRAEYRRTLQGKAQKKRQDEELEIQSLKARARRAIYRRLSDYAEDVTQEQDVADFRRVVQCFTDMAAAEPSAETDDQLEKALALLGGVNSAID